MSAEIIPISTLNFVEEDCWEALVHVPNYWVFGFNTNKNKWGAYNPTNGKPEGWRAFCLIIKGMFPISLSEDWEDICSQAIRFK